MAVEIQGSSPLIHVYDVPTSLAFYRDLLGFEVVYTSQPFSDAKDDVGWVMLRLNGVELMLNNAYEDNIRPPERDAARTAAHRDTVLYLTCPDVDGAYAYLLAAGVKAAPPVITYFGMKQLTVLDPDGYAICFQWRA